MISILLVDDNPVFRNSIKAALNVNPKYKVVGECTDGSEVLKYLKNNSEIDLVLMDISMEKMDGITATKKVLQNFPNMNIIFLTMHDQELYQKAVRRSGAKGLVLKTASIDEIYRAIDLAVEKMT